MNWPTLPPLEEELLDELELLELDELELDELELLELEELELEELPEFPEPSPVAPQAARRVENAPIIPRRAAIANTLVFECITVPNVKVRTIVVLEKGLATGAFL